MGCCFSTINTLNTNKDQNALKLHQPPSPKSDLTHQNLNNRAPPPPPVEEESVVKEVLSETPISKPQVSVLTIETETQLPKIQYSKCPIFNETEEHVSLEVSQITETRSISESFFSTTTTATTTATGAETREDEATSKLRTIEGTKNLMNRSQLKRSCDAKSIGGRERRPKSPARTPPEKRVPASPRSACQRDSGQVRRRPGEGTGRRATSPSSVGRLGDGNSRNQVKLPGNGGRRLATVKSVVKENYRKENDVITHEESLENPRVSLECFIFL